MKMNYYQFTKANDSFLYSQGGKQLAVQGDCETVWLETNRAVQWDCETV